MSEIITVRNVTKVYGEGELAVHALRGVDMDVESGEFAALAGPSGSGKTTLLNVVGCIDDATSGSIKVAGREVTELSRTEAAQFRLHNIGFVFQAYNLLPVLTAQENAEFVLELRGVGAAERKKAVLPLMEAVGLGDYLKRKPHELSGGQQQRVAVVRAIAARPAVVLADEPTANLDTSTSEALLEIMRELNRELGITFLFSSHDKTVLDSVDRVVRLDSGEVVKDERRAA